MSTLRIAAALAAASFFATGLAACRQSGSRVNPGSETTTATTSPTAGMTTTVTGCLKAGNASDTFVLTTAKNAGAPATATYQLVGAHADDLRDHVGQQVQVRGTVVTGADIASRSTPEQAEPDRTKGTSGTPTVQTQTDLQIRQLRVDAVSPQGQKCEGQ